MPAACCDGKDLEAGTFAGLNLDAGGGFLHLEDALHGRETKAAGVIASGEQGGNSCLRWVASIP